jgi:1-deoxyxylulose-5-phosphate synthase
VRYRELGDSGVEVSEVCLGSWLAYGGAVEQTQAEACVAAAFDAGVTFIDTANVYSGLSRTQILKQIDASLARLKTDYVDLYQCHAYDRDVSLEETLEALTEVVRAAIVGASRPEQVVENAGASGVELDEGTLTAIDGATAA